MLPSLSQTTSSTARRSMFFLGAIAFVALAVPALKWAMHAQSGGSVVILADDVARPRGAGAAADGDRREEPHAEAKDNDNVPEVDYLPRPSKFEQQVLAALATPVDVNFSKLALADCIDFLQMESKIPMWIDQQTLSDDGIELDQPVTLKLKSTRLESILNLLLHPAQLEYIPENEVLMITTMSKASEKLITRTYPVGDLVKVPIGDLIKATKLPDDPKPDAGSTGARRDAPASTGAEKQQTPAAGTSTDREPSTGATPQVLKQGFGGGGGRGGGGRSGSNLPLRPTPYDFLGLMNLITTTIQPDSWEDLSGPGSVMPYRSSGSLVIRQTWDVHREIQELFRSLREAKRLADKQAANKS